MEKDNKEKWWKSYKNEMLSAGAALFKSPDLIFNPGLFGPMVMGGANIHYQESIIQATKSVKASSSCLVTDDIDNYMLPDERTHTLDADPE